MGNDYYSNKLKDPRWQKLRKTILRRDKNICRACCANNKTLHVHHMVYFRGLEPWEYSKMYLVTLCEGCHELAHSGNALVLYPRTRKEAGTSPKLTKARLAAKNV